MCPSDTDHWNLNKKVSFIESWIQIYCVGSTYHTTNTKMSMDCNDHLLHFFFSVLFDGIFVVMITRESNHMRASKKSVIVSLRRIFFSKLYSFFIRIPNFNLSLKSPVAIYSAPAETHKFLHYNSTNAMPNLQKLNLLHLFFVL